MNPNVKVVRRGVTILASLLVLHCALHQIHMVQSLWLSNDVPIWYKVQNQRKHTSSTTRSQFFFSALWLHHTPELDLIL